MGSQRLPISGAPYCLLFLEVTAYLRSQLAEEILETPPVPVAMGMMMTLQDGQLLSASQVVHDEATEATYLNMVTTFSVDLPELTLSGPGGQDLNASWPMIEDVTDLI